MPYEDRRDYVHEIGGPSEVAKMLGVKSHSVVCNWYPLGFPWRFHKPLADRAISLGREPHPELTGEPPEHFQNPHTPFSLWMRSLYKAAGGRRELAQLTGIPFTSVCSMTQHKNRKVMLCHVPKLEAAADLLAVPLPDFWGTVREDYRKWLERKRKIDSDE